MPSDRPIGLAVEQISRALTGTIPPGRADLATRNINALIAPLLAEAVAGAYRDAAEYAREHITDYHCLAPNILADDILDRTPADALRAAEIARLEAQLETVARCRPYGGTGMDEIANDLRAQLVTGQALYTNRDVLDTIAALQAENTRLRDAVLSEVSLLDAWAKESKDGGWSTHQVYPMRKRANDLRMLAGLEAGQDVPPAAPEKENP